MLCRIKSCIKKLSNLTNVGCHGENMLRRRRSCREGNVEDRRKKERKKRRSGGDVEGLVWTGGCERAEKAPVTIKVKSLGARLCGFFSLASTGGMF
jgi:hypothetical protein